MDSGALDTLKEPEKEIPDYPVHRYESNCDKWALEAEMAFAKLGVADALTLDAEDREDVDRTERVALQKIYGVLLHVKGPLRNQPGIRDTLAELMRDAPRASARRTSVHHSASWNTAYPSP